MGREELQKAAQKTIEKKITDDFMGLANYGKMEPWGDQANVKPMFRVSSSKIDKTFTLIREGITLTEEQAMQIYSAYRYWNKKG